MFNEDLPRDVIVELQNRYNTPSSRKTLRLNTDLVKEILEIVEDNEYKILPPLNFPTENFSATALSYFENIVKSWMKIEGKHTIDFNTYIPSEQILKDLIGQGWVIRPPEGV